MHKTSSTVHNLDYELWSSLSYRILFSLLVKPLSITHVMEWSVAHSANHHIIFQKSLCLLFQPMNTYLRLVVISDFVHGKKLQKLVVFPEIPDSYSPIKCTNTYQIYQKYLEDTQNSMFKVLKYCTLAAHHMLPYKIQCSSLIFSQFPPKNSRWVRKTQEQNKRSS